MFLPNRLPATALRCRFFSAPHFTEEVCVGFESIRDIGMVRAEGLFPNLEGPLKQRLGLGVLLLIIVKGGKVVEADGHMGMIRAEGFFPNLERALVQRLG